MNKISLTIPLPSGQTLELVHGDLTEEQVDAIVNAANQNLQHGGGVAATIVRKGGPVIQAESSAWVQQNGPVSHAKPAYTSAGKLPCRFVIHAVGPVWGSGGEDHRLAAAIQGSLELADELELASISLPPISTGIFGFPKDRAARVILKAIREYFLAKPDSGVKQVRLAVIDWETLSVFEREWAGKTADDFTISPI